MPRVWISFLLFCIFYCGIITRLFYWQVIASERLKIEASGQHFFRFTLPSKRGTIFTSDGFPLVMNQQAYLVYAEPKNIKDIGIFSKAVSSALSIDEASFSGQLRDPDRLWAPIKHKVEASYVDALKLLKLDGLGFESEPKRYYPESSMAAHLLGFVGLDQNGVDRGYFGLEGFYDRELRGKEGSLQIEKDVKGNPILIGQSFRVDPQDGRNLTLWIDRSVQEIVERRLLEGIAKYGAKEGSIVVMDPKTGGILGMAAFPSYDPRDYASWDKELYKNPIVASTYEPGSTFKALIMASGIEAGVIEPLTTFEEDGPVEVGGYTIRTWDNQYRGKSTMTEVLEHSSNVGMVFIGNKLGKDKLLSAIRSYGFGKPTNIDLEDESAPELRVDKEWKDIDVATATFGQGIAVTPIQMVRAAAALANGGYLVTPHMVKAIVDANGKSTPILIDKARQILSKKTTEKITEMMVEAVDKGEAKWAKPKGYRIAGKTGTAQIPVEGHYDDKKTIASFIGFAPADDPKFVMLVTLRETSSSQWGSETAAPLFFTIARDLFSYYAIGAQ